MAFSLPLSYKLSFRVHRRGKLLFKLNHALLFKFSLPTAFIVELGIFRIIKYPLVELAPNRTK